MAACHWSSLKSAGSASLVEQDQAHGVAHFLQHGDLAVEVWVRQQVVDGPDPPVK